jgi:SAM-dependent methyltransferase
METYPAKTRYRSTDVASKYDRVRFSSEQGKLFDAIEKDAVLDLLGKANADLVLDLPCGTGRFASLGLQRGLCMVGADISLAMLKVAKERLVDRRQLWGLVLCDAEALPFRRESFGCIFTIRFFCHLPGNARRQLMQELFWTTRRFVVLNVGNLLSLNIFLVMIRLLRKRPVVYFGFPWQLRQQIERAHFEIADELGPLLVPPTRFPRVLVRLLKQLNRIGGRTSLRFLSAQYFLLLRKRGSDAFIESASKAYAQVEQLQHSLTQEHDRGSDPANVQRCAC